MEMKYSLVRPRKILERPILSMALQSLGLILILVSITNAAASSGRQDFAKEKECGSSSVFDLVFVVDTSGSIVEIDPDGWTKVKDFLKQFTRQFTISQSDTRVGFTVYGTEAADRPNFPGVDPDKVAFAYLNEFRDSNELEEAIDKLMFFGTSTNTPAALRVAYNSILELNDGDRPNVPNVVAVITDGVTNVNVYDLTEEASKLKKEATVVAVGVGPYVDIRELEAIATRENFVMLASDFSDLSRIMDDILEMICDTK